MEKKVFFNVSIRVDQNLHYIFHLWNEKVAVLERLAVLRWPSYGTFSLRIP